jgi:hypothetical protein
MMTITEIKELAQIMEDCIGRAGSWKVEGKADYSGAPLPYVTVTVMIADARVDNSNHIQLLIRPVSGNGEMWVEKHRVALGEHDVVNALKASQKGGK